MKMKTSFARLVWVTLLTIPLVLLTGCFVSPGNIVVRIPFEDLLQGGFYGGSLIYHPLNPTASHLNPGALISFQDLLFGWELEENDEYTPVEIDQWYGYLYVKAIDQTRIIYDYLLYDAQGSIIERADNVTLALSVGEPQFSTSRSEPGFSGISFHAPTEFQNIGLAGSSLLSFIHETPVEGEEGANRETDNYRRIVFRLETSSRSPFDFKNGIIAASLCSPRSIVINSQFLPEYVDHGEATPTHIAFYKTDYLPSFQEGDFILDARWGVTRKIAAVDASSAVYVLLETEEAFTDEALGSVIVHIEGDLEEIIGRYGSSADRERIERFYSERKQYNLLTIGWENEIYSRPELTVALENEFKIDIDISIHFKLSWKEISSKGSISYPMQFKSILTIAALAGFDVNGEKKLGEPGITFNVSGVTVKVSVPVSFTYDLKAALAELDFEFGPVLGLQLGFSYDIGAKIKFKWGFIPCGIKTWSHASGIFKRSASFEGPTITFDGNPFLEADAGISLKPGITIAGVFRPQMNIPFVIKNRLTFDAPDGLERSTGALVTNFETEGHLEVVIGVSFIKKTFHLGRVFHYTHQLGSWSF